MITEADLFFTEHPLMLIRKYTVEQLENWFGPSSRSTTNIEIYSKQLLDDIWKKYHRIDLVKWDFDSNILFFDYHDQKIIPLRDFIINNYSIMALTRLFHQLNKSYERWRYENTSEELKSVQNILENISKLLENASGDLVIESL